MSNKTARILEYVWLGTSILALFTSVYSTFKLGVKSSLVMYGLTVVAFAMYFMRRHLRKQEK
jgi:hypothetical protein